MVRGEQLLNNWKETQSEDQRKKKTQTKKGADLRWQITVANPRRLVSVKVGLSPTQARVT